MILWGLQMEDMGTGEYTGAFSATAAGAYSVSVTFQGAHIGGSPFAAEVRSPKFRHHSAGVACSACARNSTSALRLLLAWMSDICRQLLRPAC